MRANEYIKKYGVDCTKEILKHNQDLMNISFFIDLKRIIESHEYIECLGGYQFVKDNLPSGYFGEGEYKDLIQKCLEDMEVLGDE